MKQLPHEQIDGNASIVVPFRTLIHPIIDCFQDGLLVAKEQTLK
jgi:hypothetical protein